MQLFTQNLWQKDGIIGGGNKYGFGTRRTEMCGGDLMVEIEVVVVDIFHKKNRKRYTGVISRPQYIMISKIPLPSMCITTNQLLHLFCIHRIRDICFSIFQSLILSWYCQLTFKKIIFAGATNWFTYLLNSIWLPNVIY